MLWHANPNVTDHRCDRSSCARRCSRPLAGPRRGTYRPAPRPLFAEDAQIPRAELRVVVDPIRPPPRQSRQTPLRWAEPSPEAAAYAALLGELAGFGGPALLRSPWMAVLDRSESDLISLLRRAESTGLARIRAGGGVVQIDARHPLAENLGVPQLGDS